MIRRVAFAIPGLLVPLVLVLLAGEPGAGMFGFAIGAGVAIGVLTFIYFGREDPRRR